MLDPEEVHQLGTFLEENWVEFLAQLEGLGIEDAEQFAKGIMSKLDAMS